jgi:hypothetical protein
VERLAAGECHRRERPEREHGPRPFVARVAEQRAGACAGAWQRAQPEQLEQRHDADRDGRRRKPAQEARARAAGAPGTELARAGEQRSRVDREA